MRILQGKLPQKVSVSDHFLFEMPLANSLDCLNLNYSLLSVLFKNIAYRTMEENSETSFFQVKQYKPMATGFEI